MVNEKNIEKLMQSYELLLDDSLKRYSLDHLEENFYDQVKNSCLDLYLAVNCEEKNYVKGLELVLDRHSLLNLSPKESEKLIIPEHNIHNICRGLKMIAYLFAKEEASRPVASFGEMFAEAMAKEGFVVREVKGSMLPSKSK